MSALLPFYHFQYLIFMEEEHGIQEMGTMRMGSYTCCSTRTGDVVDAP